MAREAQLWDWLAKARTGVYRYDLHLQRVENSAAGRGVPDVEGVYRGTQFWIELKRARRPALATTAVTSQAPFTESQRAWGLRRWMAGGNAFLLLAVDGPPGATLRYLLPPSRYPLVGKVPEAELAESSLMPSTATALEVLEAIRRVARDRSRA